MMTTSSKTTSSTAFTIPFIAVTIMGVLVLVSAAPSAEDFLGSKIYYRNRDNQNSEDNIIPLDINQQSVPLLYDPRMNAQQSENALLNFLLNRRLILGNNRLRSYVDPSSNEISRKRSYSKYCAFNAVSCFGK